MVLFPIAFIWLLAVMIWLIRNSLNTGPEQQRDEPRRWFPRPPRRPWLGTPNGSRTSRRDRATRSLD